MHINQATNTLLQSHSQLQNKNTQFFIFRLCGKSHLVYSLSVRKSVFQSNHHHLPQCTPHSYRHWLLITKVYSFYIIWTMKISVIQNEFFYIFSFVGNNQTSCIKFTFLWWGKWTMDQRFNMIGLSGWYSCIFARMIFKEND